MARFFALLDYQGTNYSGWQIQPNDTSVQGTLQHALEKLLRKPIAVTGCGRTDAGVHAVNYVCHFDTDINMDSHQLCYKLNKVLPSDVIIHDIQEVQPEWHARFSAQQRTYKYLLALRSSPFLRDNVYIYPYGNDLDFSLMNRAAQLLPGYEEFYTFCKSNSEADHYKCQVFESHWKEVQKDQWVFTIRANRFLRGMVRLIVGMCINVGRGQLSLEEVEESLQKQERLRRPLSAPAHGLYLTDIAYERPIFKEARPSSIFFPI